MVEHLLKDIREELHRVNYNIEKLHDMLAENSEAMKAHNESLIKEFLDKLAQMALFSKS